MVTVSDILPQIAEGIQLSLKYFVSPNKRIFIGFLLTSLGLSFWVFKHSKRSQSFFRYVFHPRVWWSNSARVDYVFLLFNGVFKVLVVGPLLIFGLYTSFYFKEFLLSSFGYPNIGMPHFWEVVAYTVVLFIVRDFVTFIVHYAMHKWPFLWRFHQVHHSATVLNPVTQYRIHPVELIVNNVSNMLVIGLVTGFFDFLAGGQLPIWEIVGVNGLTFIFFLAGANLRHSHVKLKYPGCVENWLISPVQHQIHHSDNPAHFNRNLGSALAIWDRVFGTLLLSKEVKRLRFGLGENSDKLSSFWQNLGTPFMSQKKSQKA